MKHHMKHMLGCVAMIAAIAIIALAGDGLPRWVPSLILLACPIMMIWMVVMMGRDHTEHATPGEGSSDEPAHH